MKKRLITLFITIIMIVTYIPIWKANAAAIQGWNVNFEGNCQGSAEIDYNNGVDSSASLKIVCKSEQSSNVYILLTTRVRVEKGKHYTYGGTVKSENSAKVETMIDWGGRTSLLLYGKTFDFSKYEFGYVASKTKTIQLMFLIEGISDGVWFDDMFFMDDETHVNLISNPDFDDPEEDEENVQHVVENEYQQKLLDINNSTDYDIKDAEAVSSMFNHLPVFYRDNITIDADDSDWSGIGMAHMPMDDYSQIQIYAHDDEREKDLKVDYAFAYDEEYMYMYYDVYDDFVETYNELDTYWRGDSIQFMLSEKDESVGYEFGLVHDKKSDSGMIFSSSVSDEALSKCIVSTKRVGKNTIYEAAIPWSVKYKERPDEILFDFIVNDNDYNGRAYCIQLAPGIAEGKVNDEYPTLYMLDRSQDWFAWIDGETAPNINEELVYNLYVSNYGSDKVFSVHANEKEKNVTVKSGKGYREAIPITFTEAKLDEIKAEITLEGQKYEISHFVDAKRKKPTTKVAKLYQREVQAYVEEIEDLIKQCEDKGISTDYELTSLQTLKFFAGFMLEDIDASDLTRIDYTYTQLTDIYNVAKQALEGYLSEERQAYAVPKFRDDEMKIDNTLVYSDTFDGKKYENRPVFLVGYGHFSYATSNMHDWVKLGHNSIQNEIGPRSVLKTAGQLVDGRFSLTDVDATMEVQTEIKHSGERAAKIIHKTPAKTNAVAIYQQIFGVKPNKKYIGSAWVKGKNVKEMSIATDGWNERVFYTVTDEWKKIEFSFTSKDNQYYRGFRIITSDIADELYIDDISIKEEGSDEELFANGGFETFVDENSEYTYSYAGAVEIMAMLAKAEAENVSADVLLSPHYMYDSFYTKYPEASTLGGGFFSYDVNHPAARKALEDYLRFVLPLFTKYKSLNSICISNEPTFRTNRIESYKGRWHDYLKEKHGSIEVLNDLYKSQYKSFEEVDMPTEIGADPVCLDYQIFNDIEFSSWHIWMADIVHELAPGIPIHFKAMPYVSSYEGGNTRANITHGYSLEYTADSIDVNGCDSVNFITDSAGNKIQEMWYDFQVSIKDAPVFDTEHHVMADRSDKIYSDEYDAYAAANVWQGAIHYRANSVLWAWQRTQTKTEDYWGLMTQRPKAVWGMGIAANDLNRLSYQIAAFQKEKTDVAILYSDATRLYDLSNMNMIYETYNALMCLGKKVKFVTELQIEKLNYYDILFVPATDYAREETLDAVINYINNGGRVVLLGENCFKYTEYMNAANTEKRNYILRNSTVYPDVKSGGSRLSGMTVKEYKELIREYLESENKIWIEVLNAETGEICEDIEYSTAIYDSKLLVNICNYGDDVDVSVYINNEKAENSLELRSMAKQSEKITAKQYMPILLEIETGSSFIDAYGHWAENKILDANIKNLVSGVSHSRFEPDRKITRAEFVTMLVRASEMRPEIYQNAFADVSNEKWYAPYMQVAYDAGIIEEAFARPDDYITREEMCIMATRSYERKNKPEALDIPFYDANEIVDTNSVSKAYGSGLISGYEDNSFRPKGNLTRAEAVTVILNLYERMG